MTASAYQGAGAARGAEATDTVCPPPPSQRTDRALSPATTRRHFHCKCSDSVPIGCDTECRARSAVSGQTGCTRRHSLVGAVTSTPAPQQAGPHGPHAHVLARPPALCKTASVSDRPPHPFGYTESLMPCLVNHALVLAFSRLAFTIHWLPSHYWGHITYVII